jgi:hypothetical protein
VLVEPHLVMADVPAVLVREAQRSGSSVSMRKKKWPGNAVSGG